VCCYYGELKIPQSALMILALGVLYVNFFPVKCLFTIRKTDDLFQSSLLAYIRFWRS